MKDLLVNNSSENGLSKAYSDLIEQLGEQQSLKLFSDLTLREIRHLAVLTSTGDELINDFCSNYIALKVSFRRRGRKELIDLSEAFGKARESIQNAGLGSKIKELF